MTRPSHDATEFFRTAYNEYSDAIFRHCYFRIFDRERGKDLMQETFVRAWGYLLQGKKIENMRAFLYRIANNLVVDEIRRKKEVSLDTLQEKGWDPGYDATAEMQRSLEEQKIFSMLERVQPDYREAIVMRYIDGLTPAEISAIVGQSANTVSVRLHRGIRQLHSFLSQG